MPSVRSRALSQELGMLFIRKTTCFSFPGHSFMQKGTHNRGRQEFGGIQSVLPGLLTGLRAGRPHPGANRHSRSMMPTLSELDVALISLSFAARVSVAH